MGAEPTNRIKIYQYDRIFSRAINSLRSATDISEYDKADISGLVEHLQVRGISTLRVVKYVYNLRVLARMAGKPLRQLGKKDAERLVSWTNGSSYAEETKHVYKVALKKFYQWLRGCRIGETLSLRILHVRFDQHGAVLIVDDKTGPRRVRVIAAAPALASWLNIHPQRNDPNSPLWIGIGTVGRHQPLDYDGARALLRRLAKRTGLNKRLYTHLLRYTRATELANILTEAQMKELLGWVQGSDMPSVYVHLSGRDVDSALLKAHGITQSQEEKVKIAFTSTICPRCKQKASHEAQFCPACGMILDVKTAMKLEEDRARVDQIMDMLMRDEEVRKLLGRKISELCASSQPPPTS